MAALHLLHCLSKALLILPGSKKIGDPIPQRREGALLFRMVSIKVHKIAEERFDTIPLRIEVPGRTGLDFDREGSNSPYIRISASEFPLELEGPIDISPLFERDAKGEEKVAVDPVPLQLIETFHQSLIGVAIPFMDLSCPRRTHVG